MLADLNYCRSVQVGKRSGFAASESNPYVQFMAGARVGGRKSAKKHIITLMTL
jgi:hypothetical protein